MKSTNISLLALFDASRATIARNQARLADTEVEASTGRRADVGRTLGVDMSRDLEMRNTLDDLTSLQNTNGVVSTRLSQTQTALSAIRDLVDGFLQAVLASSQGSGDRGLLVADAKSRLGALADILATTSNGVYVFGGRNAAAAPVANYLAEPPGAARTSAISAFTSAFGFAPDDPQAKTIAAGQMKSYLDGNFAAEFMDPAWLLNFSSATDAVVSDRIAAGETIDSSVSANAVGIRKLVLALVAAVDGGTENLNAAAFSKLTSQLIQMSGEAGADIAGTQSNLGIAQERLAKASERISLQQNFLERRIGEAESVDAAKAAMYLSTITSQREAYYAVTARLQKLSLLNYLPVA